MFSDFYSNNKNNSAEIERTALEYLVTDSLDKKLIGNNRAKELPGLTMELSLTNQIVPSMIYTFQYNTDFTDSLGNYQFKDVVPVVLCLVNNDTTISGINFNLLPNGYRATLLDFLYETNPKYYDDILGSGDSKPKYNENLASICLNKNDREKFLNIVSLKLGININTAFRTYNKQHIVCPRLIEFDNWQYIPFLNFKDAVRGVGLAEIQAEIIKNK